VTGYLEHPIYSHKLLFFSIANYWKMTDFIRIIVLNDIFKLGVRLSVRLGVNREDSVGCNIIKDIGDKMSKEY